MKTETKSIYYLGNFCCICMKKSDLKHMFDVDNDGVSHYNKLTMSIAEMNFKEMNDQRLICGECCVTLNTVYNFRQMCLRGKTNLINYLSQLQTSTHADGTTSNPSKDVKPEVVVVKQEKESENEDSNCFEENESHFKYNKERIQFPVSVKKECESEEEASSAHEDATAGHVNVMNESNVKIENVEQQTMKEDETYVEFSKIDIKEETFSSQEEAGISGESKESDETKIETKCKTKIQKVVGAIPYKCEICKKTFNHEGHFNRHMRIHSRGKRFLCEICRLEFDYSKDLIEHKKIHSERTYDCKICHKNFNQKSHLTDHIRTHGENPYKCDICDERFTYHTHLVQHIRVHPGVRPYECELCKKNFIYKGNLTEHMKTHTGLRQYECEVCNKSFNQNRILKMHMKIHSGTRPHECEICKKTFVFKKHLTDHLRIHSGLRPYECEICKKSFTNKSTLAGHLRIHSGEKPYECEICKRAFIRKDKLNNHMRGHPVVSLI